MSAVPALLLNAALPVHVANDLRDEDQVDQHPDDENRNSSPPDSGRTRMLVVQAERETQQRRDEHHPTGSNPAEVEPVHTESAEQDSENVCGALGLELHVPDHHNAWLDGRRDVSGIHRPPRRTIPPLPLPVRVQVPAGFGGGRRRSHDSTVSDILSPDCRDGKCAACIGDAWDDTTDEPTECQHACHGQDDS